MNLQLRHRILVAWLGSLLLAMGVAGALFTLLFLEFHQANARIRVQTGFAQLKEHLNSISSDMRMNGYRFVERQDVISSLSMIQRYQNPVSYQPLIFDPEKKRLARELRNLMQAVNLPRGVLYTSHHAVVGFREGVSVYLSYSGAGEPVAWRADGGEASFSRLDDLPLFMRQLVPQSKARGDVIGLQFGEGGLSPSIDGLFPLIRHRPGGEEELVGHLVLSKVLDNAFVDEVSRSIGLELLLCGRSHAQGTSRMGCPDPKELTGLPELFRISETGTEPGWLGSDSHYAGAARLPVSGAGEMVAVIGLNKRSLNRQVEALQMAMLVGLVLAALFILGVSLFYLRVTLSAPLEQLLSGIEAVSSGRFIPIEAAHKRDELGLVATAFNDMAAKLNAQQRDLRSVNARLEERVDERTRELAVARDKAEAASRAKSMFLANMSHELRTPLNAILGFAQLMQQDANLTSKQKHDLRTIDSSGQHLLALINDVLEISRIESGRIALEAKAFKLSSLVSTVAEMVRVRAERKGIALDVDLDDGLPDYVEGDESRLRQVLVNLLGNAVKYTDSGWIAIRVRGEEREGGYALRFEVEDTGQGIGEEDVRRIFEAFYQTSQGEAKGEGTGLGLAISQQYVALMGGRLQVDSEPGRGSRFYFSIPLVEASREETAEAVEYKHVIGLEPGQRDHRILVVEDKRSNRILLRRLLEGVGLTVHEARNGQEALDQVERWRPQLVWMDMRMPVMDGYEATRRIKAMPVGRNTVVIALTASAFEEERDAVLAAGCDDFIRKPVRQSAIFAALEQHLGLRFRYVEAEPAKEEGEEPVLPTRIEPLPDVLKKELCESALALDTQAMAEAIDRVEVVDQPLARVLRDLLDEYRFDEILRLLDSGSGTSEASDEAQ